MVKYSQKSAYVIYERPLLQKNCFMVFERNIPEIKRNGSILFLHQRMTSGQPLKIVQRHMAYPVVLIFLVPLVGLPEFSDIDFFFWLIKKDISTFL